MKTNDSETSGSKCFLNLIKRQALLLTSPWIQFWLVNVIPKYLKFPNFSKDLLAGGIFCLREYPNMILSCSLVTIHEHFLVISTFTSRPTSLPGV
jgi:hypothetical protein